MSAEPPIRVPTSPTWGDALTLLKIELPLAALAVAGAFVMKGWPWIVGAVALSLLTLYQLREIGALRSDPSELVLDGDQLRLPKRSFGRWSSQTIALGPEITTMVSGSLVVLFLKNDKGGVEGVGAINRDWYRWEGLRFEAFVELLHERIGN